MSLMKHCADTGKRFLGLIRAPEFSCADCDYWNSCAAATDDCVLRAAQAKKWEQNSSPTLPLNAAAFIQLVQ